MKVTNYMCPDKNAGINFPQNMDLIGIKMWLNIA